tara:strand:- start:8753 stop:10417 length:1665 start_codon:yes stop_codon:yes gene_type:complete
MKIRNKLYPYKLLLLLFKEAGLIKSSLLILLNSISTILEILGVTIIFSFLFSKDNIFLKNILNNNIELGFLLLILIISFRSVILSLIEIKNDSLNFIFEKKLRIKFIEKILFCNYTDLSQIQRGELLSCSLSEINKTIVAFQQAIKLFQSLLSIAIFLALANSQSKEVIFLISIALSCSLFAFYLKPIKSWELGTLKSNISAKLHTLIGDGLIGLKTIKAYNAESWFLSKLKIQYIDLKKIVFEFINRNAIFRSSRDVFIIVSISLWFYLNRGQLDKEQIALQLYIVFRLSNLIGNIIQTQKNYILFITSYEKLRNVSQKMHLINKNNFKFINKESEILTQIKWAFDPRGGNKSHKFIMKKHSILAISGPSGIGKTNLIDRFVGIVSPCNGKWNFETSNKKMEFVGEEDILQLRKYISYCPQDVILFEGSLIENLLINGFDDIQKSREEVEELIKYWFQRLNLDYLLKSYKNFDQMMELSISKLSGGETKRLGLIRSFLLDRQIEVYDEPSSNLDKYNVKKVNQILVERAKKKFIIVATHDQKLLTKANKIFKL